MPDNRRFHTLGDYVRYGEVINLWCRACGRYAEVEPRPLILRHGSNADPRHMAWVCSRCGARGRRIAVGAEARAHRWDGR